MPTEDELEAATNAIRRSAERPSWGIKPYHAFLAKAALEAAEKVRGDSIYKDYHELQIDHDKLFDAAEATSKREEKLREALESVSLKNKKLSEVLEYWTNKDYLEHELKQTED